MSATTDVLEVPGAGLYYQVQGSGPVLLLIPGAGGDAGVYDEVAGLLADSFTVLTYDRRGNSRSALHTSAEALSVADQSDDARRLIQALGSDPAYVMGSGAGAVIAFDLIARYPDVVRLLIAHDPGVLDVLPDAQAQRDRANQMTAFYLREGPAAAAEKLLAAVGAHQPDATSTLNTELAQRLTGNPELTFVHETRMICSAATDIPALASAASRIVIAVGSAQPTSHPYRSGRIIAELTGATFVEVPGDHWIFLTAPTVFAATLREILTEPRRT
ncbi:alpha/beta fold hydrolase [Nocardia terpenica]|nr:alpha/beta hydrolase [Nocardia terpenica]